MTAAPPDGGAQSASDLLKGLADRFDRPRVSLGEVIDLLAERGFGLLLLAFSLPTTLPVAPPGLSAVAGFPLALLALQLSLGRHHPWLPRRLRAVTIERSRLAAVIARILPVLVRLQRLTRPRVAWATGTVARRLTGLMIALLGLLLASPIPFTNVPLSLAAAVLALSLIERDGLMTLVGAVCGLASVALLIHLARASAATLAEMF